MIILSIQNKTKDSISWNFNFIKDDGQGDFYVKKQKNRNHPFLFFQNKNIIY
jgi:hypothetical protein